MDGPIPSSFSVPSGRLPPGLRVPPGAARSSGAGRPLYPTVPGTITFTAIPPKITTITPKSFCLATLSLDDGLVSDPAQTVLNNNVERPKRPSKGPLRGSFRRPGLFSINGVDFGLDDPPFESDEPVDFGLDDPPFESDEPVDETMRIDESFSSISNAESFVGEGVPIDADGGVASGGADPFFLAAPPFEEAAQTLTEVVSVLVTPRVVIQKSPVPTYSQAKPIDRIFEKPPSPAAPNGNVADSNPGTPASPQEAGVPGNRDDNQSNGNGGNRAPGAGSGGGPRDGSPGAPIGGSPGGFNDVADGGISNLGLNGGLLGNSNPGNANGGDFNQGFVDSSDAVSNGDFDQGSTRSSNMVSGEGAPNEGLRGVFRKINGGGSNPGGSNRGGPNQGGSNQGGFNQGGSLQGSSDQRGSNQGGSNPGGSNRGGPNQGGLNQGGFNQGGFNPGGSNQGGFNQGGSNQGGSNQGGSNQGGSNQGGFNQGGFNQGGSFQGSSNQRGSNQGGFNPGGSNQGGFNPGGSNQGGSNQGGSNQGGSSSNGGGSNEGGGAIGGGFNEGLRGVFRGNPNRGGSNQGGSNAGFAGAFSEGDFRGASEGNGASRGVPGQGGLGGAPNDVGSNDGLFGGSAGGLNENINGGSNENLNGNPVPNERNTSPGAFRPPAPAEVITIDNVPIILQPNNVVIGTRTFTPGASPTDIVYNGQTFGLDASRLSSPQTTVAIPRAANAAPALVTAGGQVFSVGPAGLQAPGLTVPIPRGPGSSSFEYKGQTFRINPSQIMAADRLVDLPDESRPTPPPAFVYNGETFSIDGSRVIAPSTTLAFAGGASTVVYRGQTLTIGPSQIVGPSTTIPVANANRGPITAPPSAITAAGLAFSLGPGAAVIGSNTYSFLPGQTPTTIVYQGTTISIGPNGVAFAGTTIPIPTPPPSLHTVTAGGLTFSVGPSQAVIGGRTFIVGPNVAPTTTVVNGQTISIGPQGVGLAGTTVPLPAPGNAALSTVTAGGLTFVVGPSQAVVGGRTFIVGPQIAPTTTVVKGQTISIGPQGVGLAATTVPLPALGNDVLSTVTAGGLTFAVGPSQAVIGGRTFTIGSGIAPVTTVVNGQTISIGPRGIGLATTTVALPSSLSGYTVLTQGDLTFSLSPSHAVIGGKTYTVGPGVAPITTTINGQRVIIGPDGIGFAGTTAALPRATGLAGASIVTVDGLILTVQPTAVVIDGTTYAIGIGATPTTILVGTETISLGPGGIGLDTTTIAPAPAPAGSTRAADSVGAWCGRPWSGALIGTFLAGIVLIPFWI